MNHGSMKEGWGCFKPHANSARALVLAWMLVYCLCRAAAHCYLCRNYFFRLWKDHVLFIYYHMLYVLYAVKQEKTSLGVLREFIQLLLYLTIHMHWLKNMATFPPPTPTGSLLSVQVRGTALEPAG